MKDNRIGYVHCPVVPDTSGIAFAWSLLREEEMIVALNNVLPRIEVASE